MCIRVMGENAPENMSKRKQLMKKQSKKLRKV